MMNNMRYMIVERDNAQSLEEAINNMLTLGWVLQGGVSVSYTQSSGHSFMYTRYTQAMVKK